MLQLLVLLCHLQKAAFLANIPGVTSAAFFTTVPYNAIPITDQATLDFINAAYVPYNAAMEQMGQPYRINFEIGANAMVILMQICQIQITCNIEI